MCLEPGPFNPLTFGAGISLAKLDKATRGRPNTASPVWQVASTGLRPSQLNSAQRVTAARAPAASLAFA